MNVREIPASQFGKDVIICGFPIVTDDFECWDLSMLGSCRNRAGNSTRCLIGALSIDFRQSTFKRGYRPCGIFWLHMRNSLSLRGGLTWRV